jgi:hypothetical protein
MTIGCKTATMRRRLSTGSAAAQRAPAAAAWSLSPEGGPRSEEPSRMDVQCQHPRALALRRGANDCSWVPDVRPELAAVHTHIALAVDHVDNNAALPKAVGHGRRPASVALRQLKCKGDIRRELHLRANEYLLATTRGERHRRFRLALRPTRGKEATAAHAPDPRASGLCPVAKLGTEKDTQLP